MFHFRSWASSAPLLQYHGSLTRFSSYSHGLANILYATQGCNLTRLTLMLRAILPDRPNPTLNDLLIKALHLNTSRYSKPPVPYFFLDFTATAIVGLIQQNIYSPHTSSTPPYLHIPSTLLNWRCPASVDLFLAHWNKSHSLLSCMITNSIAANNTWDRYSSHCRSSGESVGCGILTWLVFFSSPSSYALASLTMRPEPADGRRTYSLLVL